MNAQRLTICAKEIAMHATNLNRWHGSTALLTTCACMMFGCAVVHAEESPVPSFSLAYAAIEPDASSTVENGGEDQESTEPIPGESPSSDLAKKLQNPVADLISIPFQSNFDLGGGWLCGKGQ